MALETATYISDLVVTNPAGSDLKSTLDDHARLIKSTLKNTFPNVTGATTATQADLSSISGKAPIASPTFTGVVTVPTPTTSTSAATKAYADALSIAAGNVPVGGTTGQVLAKSSGVDYETTWSTPAQSGLVLLATLTPTAAANVDFLTTFSSTYDNYLIIGDGIKPSSNDVLYMRFANAGTVDTGSKYYNPINASTSSSAAIVISPTFNGSGVGGCFSVNVLNANDATNAKTGSIQNVSNDGVGPTTFNARLAGLAYDGANAISGFRLYWNSGANFSATGKVRVYGYSNT